jgi:ubiquinone/menaquinone biosynthesis C-methylase UbiE
MKHFREWNENMFKKYGNLKYYYHPNLFIRYVERKKAKFIIKQLFFEKNKNILDIGCGDGYVLEKLHENSIGLDVSFTAIKNLKKRLVNKKVVIGDAEYLPFKKNSFYEIICSELLEHVENPEKVLQEISRVIKRDGNILLTIPNEPLINKLKYMLGQKPYEWHLHEFNLKLFKQLLNENLKITKIDRIPFFFLPIRYVIKINVC